MIVFENVEFFETLSGFAAFFSVSSKRTNYLDELVKRRLPSASTTRWNSNNKLVSVVSAVREDLMKLFENVMNDPDMWDSSTRASARGFLYHIRDFEFNFLLKTFEKIFPHATLLFDTVQKKNFDIQLASTKLEKFKTFLNKFRGEFEENYNQVLNEYESVPTNDGIKTKRRRENFSDGDENPQKNSV